MKKRNTKEIFGEAMLELLKTKTIESITVGQIVEKSGFSAKSFYNHFADKYELMLWIEEDEKRRIHKRAADSGYQFHEYLLGVLEGNIRLKNYINNGVFRVKDQFLFSSSRVDKIYDGAIMYLKEKNNIETIPNDVLFDLRMHIYGIVGVIADYLNAPTMSIDELAWKIEGTLSDKLKPYYL